MTIYNLNQAVSFEPTTVGELLKNELSARGMKVFQLSKLSGIPKWTLTEIINNKHILTLRTATQLENVLGIKAYFFLNIQKDYEDFKKRKIKSRRIHKN